MKSKNVETLLQEREELQDLPEDIMERIQNFRKEMLTELDDLEDMIMENGRRHSTKFIACVLWCNCSNI